MREREMQREGGENVIKVREREAGYYGQMLSVQ